MEGWCVQQVCRRGGREVACGECFFGGDLFLLSGFQANGCSKWFELEGGFVHM